MVTKTEASALKSSRRIPQKRNFHSRTWTAQWVWLERIFFFSCSRKHPGFQKEWTHFGIFRFYCIYLTNVITCILKNDSEFVWALLTLFSLFWWATEIGRRKRRKEAEGCQKLASIYAAKKTRLGGTENVAALSSGIGLPVETFFKNMRIAHLLGFKKNIKFHTGLLGRVEIFLKNCHFIQL